MFGAWLFVQSGYLHCIACLDGGCGSLDALAWVLSLCCGRLQARGLQRRGRPQPEEGGNTRDFTGESWPCLPLWYVCLHGLSPLHGCCCRPDALARTIPLRGGRLPT